MTSGIDLALAFVSSVSGREVAGKIQLMTEYFPSQVGWGKDWGCVEYLLCPQENYADRSLVDKLPPYQREGKQELPEYLQQSYFK